MEEGIKGKEVKPLIKVDLELEVRDKDGKLIEFKKQESHSFLRAFIHFLRAILTPSGTDSTPDTGNTSRTILFTGTLTTPSTVFQLLTFHGASGDATKGIVVGTSETAVIITQVALGSQIAHGSSSGQLNHGTCTWDAVVLDTTIGKFNLVRTFSNASGSAITVNEVGIYGGIKDTGNAERTFCIARDIISGGVSVPNGSTLTVRYIPTISTT